MGWDLVEFVLGIWFRRSRDGWRDGWIPVCMRSILDNGLLDSR